MLRKSENIVVYIDMNWKNKWLLLLKAPTAEFMDGNSGKGFANNDKHIFC